MGVRLPNPPPPGAEKPPAPPAVPDRPVPPANWYAELERKLALVETMLRRAARREDVILERLERLEKFVALAERQAIARDKLGK